MADSNQPEVSVLTDTSANSTSNNPKKRARPNDSSPQSKEGATQTVEKEPLDIQTDSQNRRYIIVCCAGRSGRLFLNKFYKLQCNKGFEKCIGYNGKLLAPHEFEFICGMKSSKAWKKSLKHNSHPLNGYMSSGVLTEVDPLHLPPPPPTFDVAAAIDSAFVNLESRLLSSVQEAIHSSLTSFKCSIDSEIQVLKDKVIELSERIQQLESNVSNNQSAAAPSDPATASNKFPDMSAVTSTVASMLQEEREKHKRKAKPDYSWYS